MRLKKLAALTALALAATALIAPSAKAQVVYNNANGDFLLGFRKEGNTNSVLVDIGPILDFNVGQVFQLGNLGTVLSSTFGAGWNTDPTVWWSLAATTRPGDPTRTNYVTSPTGVPWNRLTSTTALILQNKIIAMGNQYNAFVGQQTMGNPAVVEAQASAPDGYREYHPGGTNDAGHAQGDISFGFFNPTTETNFGAGGSVTHSPQQIDSFTLSLVQLVPGSGPGSILGTFTLSPDGSSLGYLPIPEPSTYALLAFTLTGLAVFRRRFFRKKIQS